MVPGLAGDEAHKRNLILLILFLFHLLPSVKPMKLQFFVVGSLVTFLLAAAGCESRQRSEPAAAAPKRYLSICGVAWSNGPVSSATMDPFVVEARVSAKELKPVNQILDFDETGLPKFPQKLTIVGSEGTCETKFTMPISVNVSRIIGSGGTTEHGYRLLAGPVSNDVMIPNYGSSGLFEFDRSDLKREDNLGLASAKVQRGWAAMIRPSGFPPLRTIRITTGRPALDQVGQIQSVAERAAAAVPYAALVTVEPGAKFSEGVEFIFLRAEASGMETTLDLYRIEQDGTTRRELTIKSGEYASFNRRNCTWTHSSTLPTADQAKHLPCFVQEAIFAAYEASNKSLKFFSGLIVPTFP